MDFSDKFTDDFTDTRECIVFDGDEIALAPRKRRIPIPWRIVIWVVCGLIIGVLWMCKSGGVFGGQGGGAEMNGAQGDGGDGQMPPKIEETLTGGYLENTETEGANDSLTNVETITEDEREDEREEVASVYSADLSYCEQGDGYVYNYSDRSPDTEGLLEMGFSGGDGYYTERPVVLIIHSHIREAYFDYDPNNPTDALQKSVVGVGEAMARELYFRGIPTVHCTAIHGDGTGNAYIDAEETIAEMLRVYPTIEYVIDLRRIEERDSEGKILKTESGEGCGQIRLTVSSKGALWQDNLALALELRRELNADGARLCMPVVLTDVSLNAKSSPYYLKVDVGASGNTVSEAITAGEHFAIALSEILKK